MSASASAAVLLPPTSRAPVLVDGGPVGGWSDGHGSQSGFVGGLVVGLHLTQVPHVVTLARTQLGVGVSSRLGQRRVAGFPVSSSGPAGSGVAGDTANSLAREAPATGHVGERLNGACASAAATGAGGGVRGRCHAMSMTP